MAEKNESNGITMDQLLTFMSEMNEQNQKNLLAAVAEMKKPSDRDQAKFDKEEEKIKQQHAMRLKIAEAEEERKLANTLGCTHATLNQATGVLKHAWVAKTFTPHKEKPYWRAMCQQCLTLGPKIPATAEQLQNGMDMHLWPNVSLPQMEIWAKQAQEQGLVTV